MTAGDTAAGDAVVGEDGLARCPWAGVPGMLRDYHDTEWGLPVTGERDLFERITLEAFQSGLSWATILAKRPAFREAFAGFEVDTVAGYGDRERAALLADAAIVRNRAKIDATLANARAAQALREHGGLERLVWSARPDTSPAAATLAEAPTVSPASRELSRALKRHGFTFVGPTTMHALLEATGMIDNHLTGCHRRGTSPTAASGLG